MRAYILFEKCIGATGIKILGAYESLEDAKDKAEDFVNYLIGDDPDYIAYKKSDRVIVVRHYNIDSDGLNIIDVDETEYFIKDCPLFLSNSLLQLKYEMSNKEES